jgi:glycosyltransferase involved in cell wall biosynthesis
MLKKLVNIITSHDKSNLLSIPKTELPVNLEANKIRPKVVFAGAVQNCAEHLNSVLQNIDNISELFSEAGYIFIENDSTDATRQILEEWGSNKSNFQLINFDGLKKIQARTVRLEIARNAYIEALKYHGQFKDFDYFIVLDMDEAGSYPIDKQAVLNALKFLSASPNRAAAFANQIGTYYDMWALRHETRCPGDVWEEALNYASQNKCSDDVAYAETLAKKIFSIAEVEEPIQVNSAFGGMGIYKMKYVLNNPNPYLGSKTKIISLGDGGAGYVKWQTCEHVHFHAGIKSQDGVMYILPAMINGANAGIIPQPSAFRGMISELLT